MNVPCNHTDAVVDVRWDIKPLSVLVNCECGVEGTVPLDWDDAEWGED